MTMERIDHDSKSSPALFDGLYPTNKDSESIQGAASRVIDLDKAPVVGWPVVAIPGALADEQLTAPNTEIEKEADGELFAFQNFEDVESRIQEGLRKSQEGGFSPKVQDGRGRWVSLGHFLAVDVNRLAAVGIITREQDTMLIKRYIDNLPSDVNSPSSSYASERQGVFENHPSHAKAAADYSERYVDVQSARANDRRDDD